MPSVEEWRESRRFHRVPGYSAQIVGTQEPAFVVNAGNEAAISNLHLSRQKMSNRMRPFHSCSDRKPLVLSNT